MRRFSNGARPLPPLNWIRAFEAVAHHLSFKIAADELSVTASAVSQQVKSLEEYYEIKLFRRHTRGLELTRAGELAAPLMANAMNEIRQGCDLISVGQARDWLVVTAPLSFCMKWLVPRLDDFHRKHPGIDLRLDASDELLDVNEGQADIAIRYGRGEYADVVTRPLFSGRYHVVISPNLLSRGGGINTISDILQFPLLHVDWRGNPDLVPSWEMWLKAAHLEHDIRGKGHTFSNEAMVIEAAVSELGAALVSQANVQEELAENRLVLPLLGQQVRQDDFKYYIVSKAPGMMNGNSRLLYEWLCFLSEEQSY